MKHTKTYSVGIILAPMNAGQKRKENAYYTTDVYLYDGNVCSTVHLREKKTQTFFVPSAKDVNANVKRNT